MDGDPDYGDLQQPSEGYGGTPNSSPLYGPHQHPLSPYYEAPTPPSPSVPPLPEVLAGPILRRVSPELVVVWLATTTEATLEGKVFEMSRLGGNPLPIAQEHRKVQLGAKLFVHLVLMKPEGKNRRFPQNVILGYDVLVAQPVPLVSRSVVREILTDVSLSCWLYWYPTFIIGSGLPSVLHGSCRKIHGREDRDGLAAAGEVLKETGAKPEIRPHVLLLTGDQIYADDVDQETFSVIQKLASDLLGSTEYIPTILSDLPTDPRLTSPPPADMIDIATLTYGKVRRDFTLQTVGFSTDDGEGHVLGLSEYSALYLLAWSSRLWPKSKFTEHVQRFVLDLPVSMMALANVPTYMIFDDHEVTDDWNIDQEFATATMSSAAGRRVLANALATYWAFQAWGNDPDGFDRTLPDALGAYVSTLVEQLGAVDHATGKAFEDEFLRWRKWQFLVPTEPPIFAVDTRTSRGLGKRGTAPALIDDDGLDRLHKLIAANYKWPDPLFLISATPVMGLLRAEAAQVSFMVPFNGELKRLVTNNRGSYSIKWDLEAWRNNQVAHAKFVQSLILKTQAPTIILISGDVHYGFFSEVDYRVYPVWRTVGGQPRQLTEASKARLFQFTSSPFKNYGKDIDKWIARTWVKRALPSDWDGVGFDPKYTELTIKGRHVQGIKQAKSGEPMVVPRELLESLPEVVDQKPLWSERGTVIRPTGMTKDGAPVVVRSHVAWLRFHDSNLLASFHLLDRHGTLKPPLEISVPMTRT